MDVRLWYNAPEKRRLMEGARMEQDPATTDGSLQFLRRVHISLMVSILLYIYVMRIIPPQSTQLHDPFLFWMLCATSVVCLASGQAIRSRKLGTAFEILQTRPDDPHALGQWRIGVIVSDCLAEAVALFGFVIRMLGGTTRQVAPFFVAGALAMLIWWPRRP